MSPLPSLAAELVLQQLEQEVACQAEPAFKSVPKATLNVVGPEEFSRGGLPDACTHSEALYLSASVPAALRTCISSCSCMRTQALPRAIHASRELVSRCRGCFRRRRRWRSRSGPGPRDRI
eukprot:2019460-Pleurochrysis_carterae.AAC.1